MNFLLLIICLVIPQLAGFIGSLFNITSIPTWYATLNKPSFNPPNWIFAPVWTFLFFLMGISLYLVWSKGLDFPGVKIALWIFIAQLILNILWSFFFFYLQSPLFAFIEIVLLLVMIVINIYVFYKVDPVAAYLLIPYLLWVSFATVLNASILMLN